MPILTETIEQTFALNFNLDMIAEQAYKDHILIMDFLEKRDAAALKKRRYHTFAPRIAHGTNIS